MFFFCIGPNLCAENAIRNFQALFCACSTFKNETRGGELPLGRKTPKLNYILKGLYVKNLCTYEYWFVVWRFQSWCCLVFCHYLSWLHCLVKCTSLEESRKKPRILSVKLANV